MLSARVFMRKLFWRQILHGIPKFPTTHQKDNSLVQLTTNCDAQRIEIDLTDAFLGTI